MKNNTAICISLKLGCRRKRSEARAWQGREKEEEEILILEKLKSQNECGAVVRTIFIYCFVLSFETGHLHH